MRNALGALIAVALLTGLGWVGSGQAAAPTGNSQLNVDITVTVPTVVRIEWGSTTTMSGTANHGTANGTWAIGNTAVGFGDNIVSTSTANGAAGGVLSIKNAGTSRVTVSAAMKNNYAVGTPASATSDGSSGWRWTLGSSAAVNTYAVTLTPTQPASQGASPQPTITTVQLTTTATPIITSYKVSHAEMPFTLTYYVPTDEDTVDGAAHSHEVQLTAAAQ